MTDTSLSGKTAVVTGASRGFGRATAIELAAQGAHVVGVARDEAQLDELQRRLGAAFTAVAADVADATLAPRLIAAHRPDVLVLNAGATPHPAPVHLQTWDTFSRNWEIDVRHVFQFAREALLAPLAAGSTVLSVSSGAALRGSPLSGGYAGAKATVRFIGQYAASESERLGLGIRFLSVLPQLTPATDLGSTYVDAYADYAGVTRAKYLSQAPPPLTAERFAASIVELLLDDARAGPDQLLTATGLGPAG